MLTTGDRTLDASNLTVGFRDTVTVTREAGNDSAIVDYDTGNLGAPFFLCDVYAPNASPSFVRPVPMISYFTLGSNAGKVIGQKEAYYDPTTGVVRFQVSASNVDSTIFNTAETWEFDFCLLYPKQ